MNFSPMNNHFESALSFVLTGLWRATWQASALAIVVLVVQKILAHDWAGADGLRSGRLWWCDCFCRCCRSHGLVFLILRLRGRVSQRPWPIRSLLLRNQIRFR